MTPLIWKPEYAIQDSRVDTQHERLFQIYNQIAATPLGSVDQEQLMHDLYSYAVFHFSEEEALMATVNFPEAAFERHRKSHLAFFRTLERLRTQSVETALEFFREWLLRHILNDDQEIGRFLEGRTSN